MKQRQAGPIVILAPKGYLTGGDETEELEQTIKNLAEGGNKAQSLAPTLEVAAVA